LKDIIMTSKKIAIKLQLFFHVRHQKYCEHNVRKKNRCKKK